MAAPLEGAGDFKSGQDTENAVVSATRRDRIDVGSGHQGGQTCDGAFQSPDQVAGAVDPDVKTGILHPAGEENPRFNILLREPSAADASIVVGADRSHAIKAGIEAVCIDPQQLCFKGLTQVSWAGNRKLWRQRSTTKKSPLRVAVKPNPPCSRSDGFRFDR